MLQGSHSSLKSSGRYATLTSNPDQRASSRDGRRAPAPSLAAILVESASPAFFVSEAERLEDLKRELWSSFAERGGDISQGLLDLTRAYTGALSLQLDMLSLCEGGHQERRARGAPKRSAGGRAAETIRTKERLGFP